MEPRPARGKGRGCLVFGVSPTVAASKNTEPHGLAQTIRYLSHGWSLSPGRFSLCPVKILAPRLSQGLNTQTTVHLLALDQRRGVGGVGRSIPLGAIPSRAVPSYTSPTTDCICVFLAERSQASSQLPPVRGPGWRSCQNGSSAPGPN